jgi:hypothetical protein
MTARDGDGIHKDEGAKDPQAGAKRRFNDPLAEFGADGGGNDHPDPQRPHGQPDEGESHASKGGDLVQLRGHEFEPSVGMG